MSNIPAELKYMSSHEWARKEDDGTVVVGITDHAQQALGDLVFVEAPELGTTVSSGEEAGVVESVKAASDIYTPVSGDIVAINAELEEEPELINSDPYGDGWIFSIKLADPSEWDALMTAADYAGQIEAND